MSTEINYPASTTSIDDFCKILRFFGVKAAEYTDSTIIYELSFDLVRAVYNLGKDHGLEKSGAPDLLAALEVAVQSMLDSGYAADSVVIRASRAAINKAKGES